MEEAEIVFGPAIVARPQAAHGIEPREVAFDHPSVPAEALLRFNAASRDAIEDAAHPTGLATLREIIPFVGVRFVGTMARATGTGPFERRNAVEQHVEELTVVDVGRGQEREERNAVGVDHKMALAPRSALIRRVRAENVAPLFAATVELSMATRVQSISPAQLSSWSNSACKRFHTPRRVQL
jgi:hypothetical protein